MPVFLVCLLALPPCTGQEEDLNERSDILFFSGIVVDMDTAKLSVARTVLGKESEIRDFVLNSDTRVEGKLEKNVRVTVGFKNTGDGDVAVQVIVRAARAHQHPASRFVRRLLTQSAFTI